MKILWIDLNSSYAHSSLALPALHAQCLETDEVEWNVVSATINEPVGPVVEKAYAYRPDVIAATCWLFNHEPLLHICARLKALLPQACLILGGPEFLGNNDAFLLSHHFVNCVFRGEGEEQFPRWLKVWQQCEAWASIDGLCYIDKEGNYCDNGTARVLHFDRLTPPESSRFFNWSKPFVQLETTRGCFNTCAFCVSGGEKPVRTLSIEAIEARLTLIHNHGIRDVRVLDRTFNYNPRRAKQLLQLFCRFAPHMRFHLEIHPALLSQELKDILPTLPHGLLHLEAGIQSLRQPVLQQCQRSGRLQEALDGLQFLCNLPNMETHADLIAGLPLYKLEEIFEDIQTLATYRAGEIQLESLKLLPGTEMRRRASEWGISYSPLPPYEVLQTPDITSAQLQTARLLSRLLDGYYNAPAWQSVTRSLMMYDKCFLPHFLQHLINIELIDQPLSLEKRGLLLYDFCKQHYPLFVTAVSVAWIEAGMSLKKAPAERVKTKHQLPPAQWQIVRGNYHDRLRLAHLPVEGGADYWFGFESDTQCPFPVFLARG
ncbi:MAG: DUF4080 domain-containing protein [Mediterranea massiliensis]|nr:DUF4080 domain-containing protein [Mediterranea massiliensis]